MAGETEGTVETATAVETTASEPITLETIEKADPSQYGELMARLKEAGPNGVPGNGAGVTEPAAAIEEPPAKEPATDAGDTGTDAPPDKSASTDGAKPTLEQVQRQYEDSQRLIGRQGKELGDARRALAEQAAIVAEHNRIMGILNNDPEARRILLSGTPTDAAAPDAGDGGYDPLDPNSVRQFIKNEVRRERQAERDAAAVEEQKRKETSALIATKATADELIARNGLDEAAVLEMGRRITEEIHAGKLPLIAHRYLHFDEAIEAARKEGREEAMQKVTKAAGAPKTLAAARATGAGTPSGQGTSLSSLSPEELTARAAATDNPADIVTIRAELKRRGIPV